VSENVFGPDEVEISPKLFESVPSDHQPVVRAVLRVRRDQTNVESVANLKI
jgi:hypothetical protein